MNRGSITIIGDHVSVKFVNGTIWLSQHQIATLFDVVVGKIRSNIRSIINSDQLRERDVCYNYRFDGGSIDLYNFEMILALAFRIGSPKSKQLRQWAISRITTKHRDNKAIYLQFNQNNNIVN